MRFWLNFILLAFAVLQLSMCRTSSGSVSRSDMASSVEDDSIVIRCLPFPPEILVTSGSILFQQGAVSLRCPYEKNMRAYVETRGFRDDIDPSKQMKISMNFSFGIRSRMDVKEFETTLIPDSSNPSVYLFQPISFVTLVYISVDQMAIADQRFYVELAYSWTRKGKSEFRKTTVSGKESDIMPLLAGDKDVLLTATMKDVQGEISDQVIKTKFSEPFPKEFVLKF